MPHPAMNISTRIATINGSGSDGWDLYRKARRLRAAGQEIVELTIGEHDIRTDPAILDAMDRAARAGHTGYALGPGVPELRDAIAARTEAATGVRTRRENVMIVPGGQSGLFAAHMTCCDAGDRALFLDPYYATYPGTLRAAGCVPVPVETRAADAFQPRAGDIDAVADGARSLLINTPNNPTGTVYARETLDGIARVATERDLWLISDEVYDSQVWEGAHLSPRSLPGMEERTLVVGSMSKSHAMTGSRIGWIVGPEAAVQGVLDLSTTTTYGVAAFIQHAALYALEQGSAFEAQIAEPFRRRRDLCAGIVARYNAVGLIPAQGAMYMMLDIRRTGLSGEAFANRLLDEHAIAVMPGESFGRAAAGHLRVALTIDDERLGTAVETLCQYATTLCDD